MDREHCVYEIHTPTNKVYVGMSIDIKARIRQHSYPMSNQVFKKDMKENNYRIPDTNVKVVKQNLTEEEADELETKLINKYNNQNRCLNVFKVQAKEGIEIEYPNGEKEII